MSEVVLDKKEEVKVYSGFSKRNANQEKIEQEEAELKVLQEENKDGEKAKEAEPESAEERSFKKRYGDLRRHSQQQQTQLQSQIDELKQQLEQSTSNQIKLPKSEEELSEWARQYPDVAKIVETIAIKKAKEQTEALDQRLKSLDEREASTAKDEAEAELLRLHPDFDQIRDDDEFHNWVDEQPKWVQQALYENDMFIEMDFQGYHPRLIGEMVEWHFPKDKNTYELLGQLLNVSQQDAKELTFKQLYGGVWSEYQYKPFFKDVNTFIDGMWDTYQYGGKYETENRIFIPDADMTQAKLFNYIVQSKETSTNIELLEKVLDYLKGKKTKIVLYTYDAFLFDYSKEDGDILQDIVNMLEYPVTIKQGNTYHGLTKI